MNEEKLRHRLKRLNERKDKLEARHKGNEENFTYHGGFDLGYLKGQISILEDIIDDLQPKNISIGMTASTKNYEYKDFGPIHKKDE